MNITNNETYTVKEASIMTGFKPHVIRFYEKEFELDIPRNESNRRYFTYKEIEKLMYIKALQEKGLTNKQIKMVLKSPEITIDEDGKNEAAVARSAAGIVGYDPASLEKWMKEAVQYLRMEVLDTIQQLDHRKEIEELCNQIDELRMEINSKERDVLICENAKLKMKVKEKTYEIAELKEKLKRQESKKFSLFGKIFKSK